MLIVEDNELMRAALHRFVAEAYPGEVIHDAATGADALELARRHRPRVVQMDISLPDADGIALTAEVVGELPDTRVIMVTQHAGDPYVELARAAGAFAYVVKEKIYTDLLPLLTQALGHARPADAGPQNT